MTVQETVPQCSERSIESWIWCNADWARLEVRVGAITTDEFEVVAETWFNTQIHSFTVSWLALA